MIYDLAHILDIQRFQRRVSALLKEGGKVELTALKGRRTLPQNAYLHLILGWFAMETGNTLEFVKQNYFKRYINSEIFAQTIEDKYLGKVEVLKSSKDVTTAEMTTAIERFRNWSASEAEIYLPSPNEQAFLDAIEIEMKRQKEFL